jgi:transposase
MKRVQSASDRWKAAYKAEGMLGLKDTRKDSTGRPRIKEMSIEEKYARLEAQMKLVQAENELLKKIRLLERGLKK